MIEKGLISRVRSTQPTRSGGGFEFGSMAGPPADTGFQMLAQDLIFVAYLVIIMQEFELNCEVDFAKEFEE